MLSLSYSRFVLLNQDVQLETNVASGLPDVMKAKHRNHVHSSQSGIRNTEICNSRNLESQLVQHETSQSADPICAKYEQGPDL